MKLKLDENLPPILWPRSANSKHDADTVAQERLTGRSDIDIWQAAQDAGRFLVTQDLDFSDNRQRFRGQGNASRALACALARARRTALLQRVRAAFSDRRGGELSGCFVVVTEHKLRVRRPTRVQKGAPPTGCDGE